jgi:hypothetical protein
MPQLQEQLVQLQVQVKLQVQQQVPVLLGGVAVVEVLALMDKMQLTHKPVMVEPV